MNAVLHPIDALLVFVIWIFFVFGAFLAGRLLDRIGFTRSLLLVAGGIGLGALFVWRGFYGASPDDYGLGRMTIAIILPVAMGFQNSLTSMLPRIGRSTHWTSDSTDIGIALAKGNFPLAAHNTTKIFGFICGSAALGYMIGIRDVPALYGLVLIATGFFLTTILLHWMNLALGKSRILARSSSKIIRGILPLKPPELVPASLSPWACGRGAGLRRQGCGERLCPEVFKGLRPFTPAFAGVNEP
ncbi:MAG: DUF1275 family protein [Dehalococcoidia bacterium]